jgi:hypothetical protein
MIRLLAASVLIVASVVAARAQSRVSRQGAHRMEITLERLDNGSWKVIEPGLILDRNDRVRFRFKANFPGYLYVTNRSTSAQTTLLFPRQDTGSDHRVAPNKEYLIPATQGAFRVDGPEGYDIVSWLVSPVELGRPEAPPEAAPQGKLIPRCDDAIFRARGACVDSSAGPQTPRKEDQTGDVIVIREKESSVIASAVPLKSPVVYEFHLAHR